MTDAARRHTALPAARGQAESTVVGATSRPPDRSPGGQKVQIQHNPQATVAVRLTPANPPFPCRFTPYGSWRYLAGFVVQRPQGLTTPAHGRHHEPGHVGPQWAASNSDADVLMSQPSQGLPKLTPPLTRSRDPSGAAACHMAATAACLPAMRPAKVDRYSNTNRPRSPRSTLCN